MFSLFSLTNVCFTINEAVAVVVVPLLPGLGLTNKTQAKIFAGGFVSWWYSSSVLFYHYTRTMVQFLWQCDGDGLFLKRCDTDVFWTHVTFATDAIIWT